jgi:hypothetical protein
MPTSGHFIFIPGVLLIGCIIGFVLGMRAKADQDKLEARREVEREAARVARAARKAKRAEAAKSEAAAEDGESDETDEDAEDEPKSKSGAKKKMKAKG